MMMGSGADLLGLEELPNFEHQQNTYPTFSNPITAIAPTSDICSLKSLAYRAYVLCLLLIGIGARHQIICVPLRLPGHCRSTSLLQHKVTNHSATRRFVLLAAWSSRRVQGLCNENPDGRIGTLQAHLSRFPAVPAVGYTNIKATLVGDSSNTTGK
ncbi:hypothetical protein N658DRAFT_365138 [Parathielavia hyrcaniae]|uniref:Uncharacterized protein n=1 Tax=Parathielavia hyrcaniae TaxID=113614 RepID=A0AAN6PRC3_9PEZI|nr:hypothetical protein N658DRAFT_365138 [Parathielavia hyrcaniae]